MGVNSAIASLHNKLSMKNRKQEEVVAEIVNRTMLMVIMIRKVLAVLTVVNMLAMQMRIRIKQPF
jgi:hypothetical protein